MAVTEQPATFADLFTLLQNALYKQTGVSATENQAKRSVNIALQDIHLGFAEKMPWAERSADLVTQDEYTTGTISIDQGSTTLAGTDTLWNTANAFSVNNVRVGGKLVINGSVEVYEVSAVASDTSLTLTSAFIKDDVSGGSYAYFEDEYALHADFLRPVDWQTFDSNRDIDLIGRAEFRRRYPRNKVTGKPLVATIIDHPPSGDTTPVRKVRFWKPPSEAYMIPYAFITNKLAVSSSGTAQANLSADTDEPILPLGFRYAIVLHALYHAYRDKSDDARSQEVKREYTDIMLRITGDQEIGASRPRFQPRRGPYVNRAQRPYSGAGGRRWTTGSAFDELRDR
jgi:hypothetical protein